MRRILTQNAAFFERFHDERDVALLEITHAAVHELPTTTGCALAEVFRFKQQHIKAACGRVDYHTHASGAAADHKHVPRCFALRNLRCHLLTIHMISSCVQCLERSTAFCQRWRSVVTWLRSTFGAKQVSFLRFDQMCLGLSQKPTARPAR